MSEKKICWGLSEDGTIQYQLLTQEYLQPALKVMRESFFCHENVCSAIGVPNDPGAIEELEELTIRAAKDGVTVIAVDKKTNRVAGAAFNKIQVKSSPEEDSYFENFAKNCKHAKSKAVVEYMIQADSLVDLFDLCQIDCILEIMFLGTSAEYRGRGIGRKLCEVSIDVAKKLIGGVNVKQSIDGRDLSLEPVPKGACAIFTSFITQKIGRQVGFQIAAEQSYEDSSFEGVTYASRIGGESAKATIEYVKLV